MKHSVPPIFPGAQPPAPAVLQGWPFLRLGFRPFYLGAALLACLSVPLWVAAFLGGVPLDLPVSPLLWHAHEMLFGFAAAVIMGFLLTAVKAWTGLATPRGPLLGALALLWLAARVAAVAAPYPVYAALDLSLLPLVALLLLCLLIRAGNKRNLPLIAMLLLLAAANAVFHLAAMGRLAVPAVQPLYAALGLIVMIECVMAGRVVPMFTKNVTPGLVIHLSARFERFTLASTGVALALWVFAPAGWITALACLVAAGMHGARLWKWRPQVTLKRPILWILHASYAWIVVGFALLALAQPGWVGQSLAVHAFAVGATGGLIIGMVTRTARGHTGRQLQVSRAEVLAYALVMGAAVLRVLVPAVLPQWYAPALAVAALAWAVAFAIYLVVYTPWLTRTRLDGKDG